MELKPDNEHPWNKKFYPIHPTQKAQVDKQIEVMKNQGIITPIEETPREVFNSQYTSPCMIIKKPGSTTEVRLVSDVRELNKRLLPFPPQDTMSVEQSVVQIANMPLHAISQLDVSQAYYQIGLTEDSWKFSVVSIGMDRYLIDRMIMGANSSAATWTFYMMKLLGNLYFKSVISYLDDLYLASDSDNKHLLLLNEIFSRSIKVGLQFKAAKCLFFQDKITYLGQTISKDRSIRPREAKVKALLEMQIPSTVRGLRRFLGMLNFFKTYIPELASTASPLYKLLRGVKKAQKIKFKQEHIDAMHKLKNIMASGRVVYLPDYSLDFELITDASVVGLSGVLFQRTKVDKVPQVRVIAYASRTLNQTQARYDIWVLEALAVVSSLLTFQQIVQNSMINIYTDNISLKFLLQSPKSFSKPSQSRIQKWIIIYEMFQTKIHYVKGTNNAADCLSRDLTPAGNSMLPEKEVNRFLENRLGCIQPTNTAETIQKLRAKGYKCRNNLTPDYINDMLTYPGHCKFEVIYETRSSIPVEDDEVLTPSSRPLDQEDDSDDNELEKIEIDSEEEEPTTNQKRKRTNRKTKECRKKPIKDLIMVNLEPVSATETEHDLAQIHDTQGITHDIKALQQDDRFCKTIIDYLSTGQLPDNKQDARLTVAIADDSKVFNGKLYKIKLNAGLQKINPTGYQLIVPKVLIQDVLQQVHTDTAHAALSTFLSNLKDKFYWPKMNQDANKFINECQECAKLGSGFRSYQTSYTYTNHIFNHLEVDVAGPFHTSDSGFKYVLSIIDVFSGYTINIPLRSTTSKEICEHLMHQFTIYGFPVKISTDNAQYFNSTTFKKMHEILGVHKMPMATYSPWKVGKIERTHKVLTDRLSKCIQQDPNNWDQQLKYVTFSMNATKSARTQFSPHEIIFGKPIACPSTTLIDATEGDMTLDDHMRYTTHSLANNIEQAREASQEYVRKMIKQTQERAKYDLEFQINDQVWVYKPNIDKGLPKKLSRKYDGPYTIAEVVNKNEYRLSKGLGQPKLKGSVAAQRLKPFFIKAEEPPMPDDETLKNIKRTPVPNLTEIETELKDSVTEDKQVRNRNSDIDIYTPKEQRIPRKNRRNNQNTKQVIDDETLFNSESEDEIQFPDNQPKLRFKKKPTEKPKPQPKRKPTSTN